MRYWFGHVRQAADEAISNGCLARTANANQRQHAFATGVPPVAHLGKLQALSWQNQAPILA